MYSNTNKECQKQNFTIPEFISVKSTSGQMQKYHSTALSQTHKQGQVWYQYHSQDRMLDMQILVEKSLTIQKNEKKNCNINWRTNQAVAVGHFLSSRPPLGWMGPVHWRRFPSPETHDHCLHEGSVEKWRYLHTLTVPSAS